MAPQFMQRAAPYMQRAAAGVANRLASMGRGPDDSLVHMTGNEVRGLAQRAGGMLPRNPQTGLPEAAALDDQLGADAAPEDDMAEDAGGEPEVVGTLLKYPDGTFGLQKGDEPEEGEMDMEPSAEPEKFKSWQDLVRGVIAMDPAGSAAEDAFRAAGKNSQNMPSPQEPSGPPPAPGM